MPYFLHGVFTTTGCRVLGALDLVLLGIGCIIGAGIMVLTGVAARKYAGWVHSHQR